MEVMNIKEAAAFLQMHTITLCKKAKAGLIPGAKPGKKWLFHKTHLVEYLAGRYRASENAEQQKTDSNSHLNSVELVASKSDYLKMLGLSDCPQIHSPTPDPLRGARHARAANRVAEGKAVELVGNSVPCQNRPADDVKV